MKIIHLSDLHFSLEKEQEFITTILNPLISDIKKHSGNAEFIIISGDLIDCGGKNNSYIKSFEALQKHLIKISESININKEQIIFCPGNHDIERNNIIQEAEFGISKELDSLEEIDSYLEKIKLNIMRCQLVFSRLSSYNEIREFFISKDKDNVLVTPLTVCQKFFINGKIIGISCLNSVWRCNGSESLGDLRLGSQQLREAETFLKGCDLKICVMHHTYEFFAEFEKSYIRNQIENFYDFFLTGHTHTSSSQLSADISGSTFHSVAPQLNPSNFLSDSKDYSNGYRVITLDNNEIISSNRRFNRDKNQFVANTDRSDSGEDGIQKYLFNKGGDTKTEKLFRSTIETLLETSIEMANAKLITYDSNTEAPTNIKEIFVQPPITEEVENENSKKETIDYSVADIIKSNENFVLFGPKESGISTLLNKIHLEFLSLSSSKKIIPILINYQSKETFQNSSFDSFVSRYTGIRIKDLRSDFKKYNFVLLIDNMNFDSSSQKPKKIAKFIEKYPNTRIICAGNKTFSGGIPTEYYKETSLPELKPLSVGYFKTKQIRGLVTKWFSANNTKNTESQIEKIIELCSSVNITSSPLSISMLLWIFENDKVFKPLNYGNIIEIYIERLLDKHSETEIYQDKYDFKNQLSALSKISYEMFCKFKIKASNTVVTYGFIYDVLENYIKVTSSPVNTKALLDHFIYSGIFEKTSDSCEKCYRFRYPCFYHYFLAKRMEQNEGFRKFTTENLNYLDLFTEIDLFSSMNRSSTTILDHLLLKLDELYNDINKQIENSSESIDDLLEIDKSFARNIDENFIDTLKEEKSKLPEKTQQQVDEIRDTLLDKVEVKQIEGPKKKKSNNFNTIDGFEGTWVLAFKVLKNLENIDNPWYREKAFIKILRCSILCSMMYKTIILEECSKDKNFNKSKIELLQILLNFMPVAQQTHLSTILNSSNVITLLQKIWEVINGKLEIPNFELSDISNLEKFIIFNLIADNNINKVKDDFKPYHEQLKYNYLLDNELIKLMIRYQEIPNDNKELNQISLDVLARFKYNMSPEQYTSSNKKLYKTPLISFTKKEAAISSIKQKLSKSKLIENKSKN